MRDLISDFNSREGNSESNSVKCNSDSYSNDGNSIPPGLGQANSITIPELDLESTRNSNSGTELTPALLDIAWQSSDLLHSQAS